MLLLLLQFVLVVVNAEAEREVQLPLVGVLGSSVLLDPEITVGSSKSEILWTFKGSNKSHDVILDHIPGVATSEPSEQFKDRLQFNALSGALTISRLNASDQGDYTFTVDGKELKIMELLVIDNVKEEVGLLSSSVLLDPELKVDPSKSEIVRNFSSRDILRHVPGHSLVELRDQFKFRLHFNTSNGALTVNGAEHGDQEDDTFFVDGQMLRRTEQRHFGLSFKEIIVSAASTAGQVISVSPLHSAMLPDQWRWKTLGGTLGNTFYISILCICNSLLLITMYIMPLYWTMDGVSGFLTMHFVLIVVMIAGQGLSSLFITVLLDVTRNSKILEGSQSIRIWLKLKAVCDIVLKDCFIIFCFIFIPMYGLSKTAIVSIALSIVLPFVIILILMYWFLKKSLDKGEGERNQRNERKVRGCSFKAILIAALWFVFLMLPLTNVIRVLYVICRNPNEELVFFETGIFNLISLMTITVLTLIPVIFAGFYYPVMLAASIIVDVLFLMLFIALVIFWYRGFHRLRRWTSVYNVHFLTVINIATIFWMVFDGLRPEDVGVAIASMVGLAFSTAYAIIFMCWSWKGFPEDKQWWWCLNISNIVSLVSILIALICWTGRNKGTNGNNRAEMEQDHGEMQELQTLSPGHEA
ncbi:uncharacterized protein LOC132394514 isoform X2 [Hypanus sabinus]|uniref:uncharacterized protein LOC132394514 isoform X2 n=1 Tax=Hypanus sabinus TaxID=79690 RepID=UPI0028C3E37D|nr:uncharacterized protein LOC132394514 isoform X2 [Hypanus sabinus]